MAPVCAVVVAGGSGQRFGNPGGKQLVNVAGRPLMSWSIRAFDRSDKVGHIVVVCPAERRAEMRRLAIDPFDYDTPISFADAGDTRQDSTRAGVHAVPAGFEYVAIHDGARPLVGFDLELRISGNAVGQKSHDLVEASDDQKSMQGIVSAGTVRSDIDENVVARILLRLLMQQPAFLIRQLHGIVIGDHGPPGDPTANGQGRFLAGPTDGVPSIHRVKNLVEASHQIT